MFSHVYPTYVVWKAYLTSATSAEQLFGPDQSKRIKKSLAVLADSPYAFVVNPVDDAYLAQFIPLYQKHMAAKQRGVAYDVAAAVASAGRDYQAISLWDRAHHELLGGLIYSIRKTTLNTAYRVFPRRLPVQVPISVSYVAEHYLFEKARMLQKRAIIHGRDRNPYGLHSAIGVAMFKLGVGYAPYVSRSAHTSFHSIPAGPLAGDRLYLLGTKSAQKITRGVLCTAYTAAGTQEKYNRLFTNPRLTVVLHQ